MATLMSKDRNQVLLPELRVASSFWHRLVGLIGTQNLSSRQALWIERCHSIHTFFMSFSIDCVFVSKDNKVVSIKENIHPYRITWRQKNAVAVVELPAGQAKALNFKIGEQLYVGS